MGRAHSEAPPPACFTASDSSLCGLTDPHRPLFVTTESHTSDILCRIEGPRTGLQVAETGVGEPDESHSCLLEAETSSMRFFWGHTAFLPTTIGQIKGCNGGMFAIESRV
jgi:hypothetical protein